MTMLVARGLVDALLMIAVVAVLTGMYLLRRYARAQTIYRRADDPATSRQREAPPPGLRRPAARTTVGGREGAA
ncbi:hypothetical protein [Actinoplanes sp. NPDC026623]|uniref:hypothetical protein n=1 Tax=Actinoplanes sp. NPDC026623 TaxID=3155610 RepID=UPI00340DEE2F